MIDITFDNNKTNADLLLQGIWYLNLPNLLDISELSKDLDAIFSKISAKKTSSYVQDEDGFITDWRNITPPPDVRKPGVEALSFFDFKKNKSLREMQISNLLHYLSFMYNTLLEFEPIFQELYTNDNYANIVANSNSYLVFGDVFLIHKYELDEGADDTSIGIFTTKNNKINSSATLLENKRRLLLVEADYLHSLKMDIESFFPRLYTHYFEKFIISLPCIIE